MIKDNDFSEFCRNQENRQFQDYEAQTRKVQHELYSQVELYTEMLAEMVKKADCMGIMMKQAKENLSSGNIDRMSLKLLSANRTILQLNEDIRHMMQLFTSGATIIPPVHISEKMAEGIKVEYTKEGWPHILMYSLLPHKKKTPGKSIVYYSLAYAINRFLQTNETVVFDKAVLIVRQIYSQDTPLCNRKDCDNVELTVVINALSSFFLKDDSPDILSVFSTSAEGETCQTELFLVPEKSFIVWNLRYK